MRQAGSIKKTVEEENGVRVEVKPKLIQHYAGLTVLAKFDGGFLEFGVKGTSLRKTLQVRFNGSISGSDVCGPPTGRRSE